jgi:hypothetical protein
LAIVAEPRNPKEPQNLTLSNARLVGGKLRINLRWVKPASDVPISFYKVFWSRLIHGPANDSILVYHKTILKVSDPSLSRDLPPKSYGLSSDPSRLNRLELLAPSFVSDSSTLSRSQPLPHVLFQDKTCYELKNLELKCQYFLQVQAVAVYGGRRLTSRKASKVFNSTDYMAYGKIADCCAPPRSE